MLVELKKLQPNPLRDFKVDPVDKARVTALKESIEEDGFWGGILCRRLKDRTIEVIAGQHRVEAALEAGIRTADVFVADIADMDDAQAVRAYSRENTTQRGNSGTAQAGSVAAAVRFFARALAEGNLRAAAPRFAKRAIETAEGTWAKDGIGRYLIEQLLEGTGVSGEAIKDQLASLKDSGQYARIVSEVREQIEEENRERLKELERKEREQKAAEEAKRRADEELKAAAARAKAAREEADRIRAEKERRKAEIEAKLAAERREKMAAELAKFDALRKTRDSLEAATAKADEREVVFDQEGVQRHLRVPEHVTVFRKLVSSPGIKPYVKVNQQAGLARDLVAEAKERKAELTAGFIREHLLTLAQYGRTEQRRVTKDEQEARERQHLVARYQRLTEEMGTALRTIMRTGHDLAAIEKSWPRGLAKPISREFRHDVELAWKVIKQLHEAI